MPDLFKHKYMPYVCFLAGVVLILLWVRSRKVEGFANAASQDTYNFDMYYADWCPHCHSAKPEFDKLGAIQTIGGKKVACNAIEAEKHPEQVRGKVSGYPTIQLYDPKGKLVSDYSGPRTLQGFQSFLEEQLKK